MVIRIDINQNTSENMSKMFNDNMSNQNFLRLVVLITTTAVSILFAALQYVAGLVGCRLLVGL